MSKTVQSQVYSWNYSTQGVFPDQCGVVQGSAGEFYTPHVQKNHIDLFSNDLCRSIRLPFTREVEVSGIKSYEFVADRSFFANGTENPLNSCYEPVGEQLFSGVYNTSLCRLAFTSPALDLYSRVTLPGMEPRCSSRSPTS